MSWGQEKPCEVLELGRGLLDLALKRSSCGCGAGPGMRERG